MKAILLDLGIIQISWYSIIILLGIFIGGGLVLKGAKKFNLNNDFMTNLIFWSVIFGIIGARLYYVLFNFSYYQSNWADIFKIWEGGLAIHGAIIAALLFVMIYAKKYKVKLLMITDIMVVGVIIGQAIGRWGNFFNQEAHGSEVSITFLNHLHIPQFIIEGMNINGTYYHPTFLYESLWCLIGFIVLLFIRRYKYLKIGQLTGIYFMWYAVGRFFIEMLRTDSLMLGTFKAAQIISFVLFMIGVYIVYIKSRGSKFENLYNNAGGTKNEIRF